MYCDTWPKSNAATLVPEPASATPLVSVRNVRLSELWTVAVTVSVPELVCPRAEVTPRIKNKLRSNTADKMALFFMLVLSAASVTDFSRQSHTLIGLLEWLPIVTFPNRELHSFPAHSSRSGKDIVNRQKTTRILPPERPCGDGRPRLRELSALARRNSVEWHGFSRGDKRLRRPALPPVGGNNTCKRTLLSADIIFPAEVGKAAYVPSDTRENPAGRG
jgi:hypothetical protein